MSLLDFCLFSAPFLLFISPTMLSHPCHLIWSAIHREASDPYNKNLIWLLSYSKLFNNLPIKSDFLVIVNIWLTFPTILSYASQ
jgi:hypothetical protein